VTCVVCHPDLINALKSFLFGASGIWARLILKSVNCGGLADGNDHVPIFNGTVVDINNSPETVRPKFSKNVISSLKINGV
jgi:hypothetical protein